MLVELGLASGLVETLLHRLQVGEGQLDLHHAQVIQGIRGAGDVVVDERPEHEHDGVDLADVGEELVAQALALRGALDEPADVDDFHGSVHEHLGLAHRAQALDALVGYLGHADVGVLGGEGVWRSERAPTSESVVQRALARVGETDQAEAFHSAREATGGGVVTKFADPARPPCPVEM